MPSFSPLWVVLTMVVSTSAASAQVQQLSAQGEIVAQADQHTRFRVLGSTNRTEGIQPQAEMAVHVDLLFKRLAGHGYDMDASRASGFRLSGGYSYLPAANIPAESRGSLDLAGRRRWLAGIVVADRNRSEFRWIAGVYSFRYRNLLTLERSMAIDRRRIVPYISAEPFRDSRYAKWNQLALSAGAIVPIGQRMRLDGYYEHDHQTGTANNQQVNRYGVKVSFFLRQTLATSQTKLGDSTRP